MKAGTTSRGKKLRTPTGKENGHEKHEPAIGDSWFAECGGSCAAGASVYR